MNEMTPHEEWVARTMLVRGWEPWEVADALGHPRPRAQRAPHCRLNEYDGEVIVRMWTEGYTITAIALEVGASPKAVSMWAARHRDECPARHVNKRKGA